MRVCESAVAAVLPLLTSAAFLPGPSLVRRPQRQLQPTCFTRSGASARPGPAALYSSRRRRRSPPPGGGGGYDRYDEGDDDSFGDRPRRWKPRILDDNDDDGGAFNPADALFPIPNDEDERERSSEDGGRRAVGRRGARGCQEGTRRSPREKVTRTDASDYQSADRRRRQGNDFGGTGGSTRSMAGEEDEENDISDLRRRMRGEQVSDDLGDLNSENNLSAEPVRPVDGTVDPADSVEKEHKDDEILTETKVGNSTVSSTNERKEKTRYAEYETYFEEKFDPFNSGTENWEWGEDENDEGDFPSIFDHEEIDEYDDWDSPDERLFSSSPGASVSNNEYTDFGNEWEWETTPSGGASVLLPPPIPRSKKLELPNTIIHFVGGTIFGSYPTQFYSDLLESVAKKTNSVVIATNIPITLNQNPLNHLALSNRIVRNFREAYFEILCDEYGEAGAITNVPIVGVGHSLGARLQVVVNTDARLRRGALPRSGNVLIGFNNYGAIQSVPGVKTLRKGARDVEKKKQLSKNRSFQDEDLYEEEEFYSRRSRTREYDDYGRRQRSRRGDRYNNGFDYDDNEEFEDEVEAFFSLVSESFQNGLKEVKTALTPLDVAGGNLEFQPSPDEVWESLSDGEYCEHIQKTLVVQFDRDGIDQGARLARSVLEEANNEVGGTKRVVDIKFARLPGMHLTPVSYDDGLGLTRAVSALSLSSLSFDMALKDIIGEDRKGRSTKVGQKREEDEIEALISSVSRYITDVVVGDNLTEAE